MKSASRRRMIWLSTAIAAFAAAAVWADGELDAAFGTNGAVKISLPNSTHGYLRVAQTLANGTIEAAGFAESNGLPTSATPAPDLFVAKLSATGVLSSAQSYSQAVIKVAINGPAGVAVDPRAGDLFVTGSNVGSNGLLNATVYWLNSAGEVRRSYTRAASSTADQSACVGFRPILDSHRYLVASCVFGDTHGVLQLAALRLIPRTTSYRGLTTYKLEPDTTFGVNGFSIVATFPAGYTGAGGTSIVQNPNSGDYYVGGFACNGNCLGATSNQPVAQVVARLSGLTGALDTTYGNAGFAVAFAPLATGGNPEAIALDSAGNAVIGGNYSTAGSTNGTGYVARLNPAGTPDGGFGTNGVVQGVLGSEVTDVATDATNRVYALDHSSRLFRLGNGGVPDTSFMSATDVQTLNGVGSAWQSMQFVDSSQSSALLAGGAGAACTMNCAATAIVARVALVTSSKVSTTSLTSTPNPGTVGGTVNFTATVTGAGPAPIGTVAFQDGTTSLGSSALSGADATFSTNTLSVGYHNITAIYAGDSNYVSSASPPLTETIYAATLAPSTTNLALAPAVTTVGQSITLTATVTGANPTGTVTFSEGAYILGVSQLVGNVSTLSTDVLTVGTHDIIASYDGDTSNQTSSSAPASATVGIAASLTALALAPAASTVGQSVSLSATVTGVAGLIPTGSVSFMDGTTALGTDTLKSDGTISISTTALSVGSHTLTAQYGGDANYNPSTSAGATAMVNAMPVQPGGGGGGGGGGAFNAADLLIVGALFLLGLRRHAREIRQD